MAAMQAFLSDYESGKAQGRYIGAELPALPFADSAFDIALCSHLLFVYSVQLGEAFHRAAVLEMCRVAADIRIFPLLALGGDSSPFVAYVCGKCAQPDTMWPLRGSRTNSDAASTR